MGCLGPHNRLNVRGIPARRAKEERKVEAQLRTDIDGGDAPFYETLRLLRVSQSHSAVSRGKVRQGALNNIAWFDIEGREGDPCHKVNWQFDEVPRWTDSHMPPVNMDGLVGWPSFRVD